MWRFVDRCRVGDGKIFSVREGRATTAFMIRARPVGFGVGEAESSEVGEKYLRKSIYTKDTKDNFRTQG